MKKLGFLLSILLFSLALVGCSTKIQQTTTSSGINDDDVVAAANGKQPLPPPDLVFLVHGEGIAPKQTMSPAQAVALAKRAAVADGYRQLGEKLYGVKVNSTETVKDAVLQNSLILVRVDGLIRNAQITNTEFKDGLYVATMELRISRERWRSIFF